MAEIYTKLTENTLILAPREMVVRPFNFGAWTEIRLGILATMVTSAGNDSNAVSETVAIASALDYYGFGIKTDNTILPRVAGADFIGMQNITAASSAYTSGTPGNVQSASNPRGVIAAGASVIDEATNLDQMDLPQAAGASGYCGFYGLRIVIGNAGLSTQTVTIGAARRSTVSGTDYSNSVLRSNILSGGSTGYTMGTAKAWNTGVAARALPDAFYLRMPFYNARMRLSAMGMIKVA